jgi:hypothetical protein
MYYLNICLGGLRKSTKDLSQDSWTLGWDLLNRKQGYIFFKDFPWACLFSLELIYLLTAKLHISHIISFQKGRKVVLATHLSHVIGTGYSEINCDKQLQDSILLKMQSNHLTHDLLSQMNYTDDWNMHHHNRHWMMWLSGQHSCFVFRRCWAQFSTQTDYHTLHFYLPQFLHANATIMS